MPVYALDDLVPAIDPTAYIHPEAVVIGAVELAAGASVWPGALLRDHGPIRIGERTSVQDGSSEAEGPRLPVNLDSRALDPATVQVRWRRDEPDEAAQQQADRHAVDGSQR